MQHVEQQQPQQQLPFLQQHQQQSSQSGGVEMQAYAPPPSSMSIALGSGLDGGGGQYPMSPSNMAHGSGGLASPSYAAGGMEPHGLASPSRFGGVDPEIVPGGPQHLSQPPPQIGQRVAPPIKHARGGSMISLAAVTATHNVTTAEPVEYEYE